MAETGIMLDVACVLWDELNDAPATRTDLLRAVGNRLGKDPANGARIDKILVGLPTTERRPMARLEGQHYVLIPGTARP